MDYQQIRKRFINNVRREMPGCVERLGWTRDHVLANQEEQLAAICGYAREHSSWYRSRLQDTLDRVGLAHLEQIQPTTKADLMEHWDDIICRKDITKSIAEGHLA